MKTIVIIATFVACCFAASALNLQHPSPINPSVLAEVKPQEKAVLITDPLEIAKFKREVQPLYPTILPEDRPHHLAKRKAKKARKEEISEEESSEDSNEDTNVKEETSEEKAYEDSEENTNVKVVIYL